MSSRIYVVIGADGLLGHNMVEALYNQLRDERHTDIYAFTKKQLDITDSKKVFETLSEKEFINSTIINCAAATHTDKSDLYYYVNVKGTQNLATLATHTRSRLVHISSNYAIKPIEYYVKEIPLDGLNMTENPDPYSQSKAKAELIINNMPCDSLIVRTAWLYGAGKEKPPAGFVTDILTHIVNNSPIIINSTQIGQPTLAKELAFKITKLLYECALPKKEIVHIVGPSVHSRFSWALELVNMTKSKQCVKISELLYDPEIGKPDKGRSVLLNTRKADEYLKQYTRINIQKMQEEELNQLMLQIRNTKNGE